MAGRRDSFGQTIQEIGYNALMILSFKLDHVESLIGRTRQLLSDGAEVRDGFGEPGLFLASQFGAGVYLMSGMVDDAGDWTADLVFAEHCNPNAADYLEEIADAAYGNEETAEMMPLATVQQLVATARGSGRSFLSIARRATAENRTR